MPVDHWIDRRADKRLSAPTAIPMSLTLWLCTQGAGLVPRKPRFEEHRFCSLHHSRAGGWTNGRVDKWVDERFVSPASQSSDGPPLTRKAPNHKIRALSPHASNYRGRRKITKCYPSFCSFFSLFFLHKTALKNLLKLLVLACVWGYLLKLLVLACVCVGISIISRWPPGLG